MNIDMSRAITTTDKAVTIAADLLSARKSDCRARIFAIAGATTQINLAAAAAAGLLDADQMATYRAGLAWVEAMRAACATGIWPEVPAGVAELAATY